MKVNIGHAALLVIGLLFGLGIGFVAAAPFTEASAVDSPDSAGDQQSTESLAPDGGAKSRRARTKTNSDADCQAALAEARRALALMEASMTRPAASWPSSLPENLQPPAVKAALASFVEGCEACSDGRIDCSEPPCLAMLKFQGSPATMTRANLALTNWPDFGEISVVSAVAEMEDGFYLIKAIVPVRENKQFAARVEERIKTMKSAMYEGWLDQVTEPIGDRD